MFARSRAKDRVDRKVCDAHPRDGSLENISTANGITQFKEMHFLSFKFDAEALSHRIFCLDAAKHVEKNDGDKKEGRGRLTLLSEAIATRRSGGFLVQPHSAACLAGSGCFS